MWNCKVQTSDSVSDPILTPQHFLKDDNFLLLMCAIRLQVRIDCLFTFAHYIWPNLEYTTYNFCLFIYIATTFQKNLTLVVKTKIMWDVNELAWGNLVAQISGRESIIVYKCTSHPFIIKPWPLIYL